METISRRNTHPGFLGQRVTTNPILGKTLSVSLLPLQLRRAALGRSRHAARSEIALIMSNTALQRMGVYVSIVFDVNVSSI